MISALCILQCYDTVGCEMGRGTWSIESHSTYPGLLQQVENMKGEAVNPSSV